MFIKQDLVLFILAILVKLDMQCHVILWDLLALTIYMLKIIHRLLQHQALAQCWYFWVNLGFFILAKVG